MIAGALELLASFTLLTLLVLAVRRPVAEIAGAEWAYALWLVPVVVPFLPPLPLLPSADPSITFVLPTVSLAAASQASEGEGAVWLQWLLALWAGGAAVFAIWQQSTYSAFMLHLGRDGRRADPPVYGGIKVVESEAVEGPVAVGVVNRRIVVPLDFASRYTPAQRGLALEHELVHHRRLDVLWNWVGLAIVTVNWFNPVAHIAFRAFRSDQELACDAAVTRRVPAARHDYACALVKAASFPGVVAACPLNRADFLKRRLKMMKQHRSTPGRTIGGIASLCLIAGVGVAIGGPGFAHRDRAPAAFAASALVQPARLAAADISTLHESREENRGPKVEALGAKDAGNGGARRKPVRTRAAEAIPDAEPPMSPEEAAQVQAMQEGVRLAGIEAADRIERMARIGERLARFEARLPIVHDKRILVSGQPGSAPRVIIVRTTGSLKGELESALSEAERGIALAHSIRRLSMAKLGIERELRVLARGD